MRKKLKLGSDGGDCGSKECKRGYSRVWRNLSLAGVWSQSVVCVLVLLADVFTFNLVSKMLKIMYFQCALQT
jgi:hypothetical protein